MDYDIVADYGTLQIYEDENGLYGLLKDRELFLQAEFAEITHFDGADYLYCRRIGMEKYVLLDGRIPHASHEPMATCEDEEVDDNLIVTCDGFNFGLSTKDGRKILPVEYDQVVKWPNCNVVYIRKGRNHKYIDKDGNEILKNVRHIEGATDSLCPYYQGEPQTNVIQLMDLRDKPSGDDFIEGYGRRVGLSRRTRVEHFDILTRLANVRPLQAESRKGFLGKHTYIFASYAVQSRPGCADPFLDCLRQLDDMGQFNSSWNWVLVAIYPDNALISQERIDWFCRCVEEDCPETIHSVGIGRSSNISDDSVVLFATRYFSDQWPTDREWFEMSIGRDWTLHQLKQFLKGGKNRRLLSSAMINVLRASELPWKKQLRQLNYLSRCGAKPFEGALMAHTNYISDQTADRMVQIVKWLIEHGADVNVTSAGKSVLDNVTNGFQADDYPEVRDKVKEILFAEGAKTFEEIRSAQSREHGFNQTITFIER